MTPLNWLTELLTTLPLPFLLLLIGLVAGSIDSIAGGGGLISLPALFLLVGQSPLAIGTNKVAGSVAAFVALLVYLRGGHMKWRQSVVFTLCVAIASWTGSQLSPHFSPQFFRTLLWITCPSILIVLWNKDLWIKNETAHPTHGKKTPHLPIILSGLACGLYDGAWGPGGGTFMFLALVFAAKLPLLTALAASKLANTCSALSSLAGYASQGYVNWTNGFFLATGMCIGAYFGASYASKHAARIIRPVLTLVVAILMVRLLIS